MTEAEWLKCSSPRRMLDQIRDKFSERKMVLFCCASCRRVWDRMTDSRSRCAVETVERYADGLASEKELLQARKEAERACIAGDDPIARAIRAAYAASWNNHFAVNDQLLPGKSFRERQRQAALLSDILGNPFRPVLSYPNGFKESSANGSPSRLESPSKMSISILTNRGLPARNRWKAMLR